MKNKVLNEYYKDYLKKISKDNIEKYNNERKENSDSSNKKNEKKLCIFMHKYSQGKSRRKRR